MSFTLPQLTYGFDALEPNIDARTMEIHYGNTTKVIPTTLMEQLKELI